MSYGTDRFQVHHTLLLRARCVLHELSNPGSSCTINKKRGLPHSRVSCTELVCCLIMRILTLEKYDCLEYNITVCTPQLWRTVIRGSTCIRVCMIQYRNTLRRHLSYTFMGLDG